MPRFTRAQRPGRHLLIATLLYGAALLGCSSSGGDGGPDGGQQLPDGGQQLPDGGPGSGSAEALCTEGWCWENPRPMGLRLSAVWMDESGKGWVGGRRTGLLHWDGTRFTATALPAAATAEVTSLWGSAPDNVWAVAGVLLHFDGKAWSVDERAGTNLTAVWGTGASDVWATAYGRILHFDGSTWTEVQSTPTAYFTAIHGTAPDNVWAVGYQGVVHHWDGQAWTASSLGDLNSLLKDVWVGAANDVWAAGDFRGMWHFDGESWTRYPSPHPNQTYTTVWGVAGQFVWAGGNAGAMGFFSGSAWVERGFMPTSHLTQLRGRSADDLWAVGEAGFFAVGDQTGWRYPAVAAPHIEAVFTDVALVAGEGGVQAWAVGPGRLGGDVVARREPAGVWRRDTSTPRLDGAERVAASGPNDIWTRNDEATLHFDGTSWRAVPVPEGMEPVGEICTFGPSEAWALAETWSSPDLKVLRWDGTVWSVDATLPASGASSGGERLRTRLFCLSREELWVGGPNLLLRRKEGHWQRFGVSYWNASGWDSSAPRLRLRAFGPQDVWAVKPSWGIFEDHSTVVHFDGRDWREVALPGEPAPLIHDVHGTSGSDVWLAGGTLLHWDGSELARIDIGHQGELRLVWAFAPNDVLFVGSDLKTYRWNGSSVTTYTPAQPRYGPKNDAWFASPDFGFLLDDVTLLRWDGSQWNQEPALSGFYPTAIWGTAANDVWLVGNQLKAAHWDGSNWTVVNLNGEEFSSEELIRVWGATSQDVWAVGKEGSLFHNTGDGFVRVTPETPVGPALAIGGTGVDDVWFLGRAAAHWNGTAFSPVETLDHPVRIQRVGGALMAADVWGAVWRDGEEGFRRLSPDIPGVGGSDPAQGATFTSAAFVSEEEGYLIGEAGNAWRFDGTGVTQIEALSSTPPLWEVEALGQEVFMVGAFGTVLRKAP